MDKDTARILDGVGWAAFLLCVALGIADKSYVWAAFALVFCVFFLWCRSKNPSKTLDESQEANHEGTATSQIVTDSRLLGIWELDRGDASTTSDTPEVRLHFFPTGEVTYTCKLNADKITKRLTYTIDGDTIVIHDPTIPAEEQILWPSNTHYSFRNEDGTLHGNGGLIVRYRRVTTERGRALPKNPMAGGARKS